MEHIHGSYESTNRFRINPFSRQIINESEMDIVITQYDHNSERFIFELPKVVEEHDMTQCSAIRIHYINAGSNNKFNKGIYEVTDLKISEENEDNVTFSWLLSKGSTSLDGVLSFAIQFICTTDGEVNYSWSTLPFKQIKIPETYDNSEDIIEEDYSDILERWMEELLAQFGSEIDTKLDEKISERTYTRDHIDSILTSSKTEVLDKLDLSALKASARGEVVRVDDVSPVEHKAIAKVSSKNLIPFPYPDFSYNIDAGITVTLQDDGGVLLNGTATEPVFINLSRRIKYSDVDVNHKSTHGMITNAISDSICLRYDSSNTTAYIYVIKGTTCDNIVFYPQLEIGYTATEYTPYVDVSTATVNGFSKNLLESRTSHSETVSGVTFTIDEAGKCKINGTNTTDTWIFSYAKINDSDFYIPKGTTVTVSGINCTDSTYAIRIFTDTGVGNTIGGLQGDYYSPTTITLEEDTLIKTVLIRVGPNATVNNAVVTPQIEIGSNATDYEPYVKPTTHTPASDGTLEIDSIAPTMTLLADKSGVNIDVKYNRDINKAFEEIYQAIISLGGNI